MPAWKTYVAVTPQLSTAKQSSFENLFWVARLIYHDIAGEPLGRVGERLTRTYKTSSRLACESVATASVTFDPTNPHEISVGSRRYALEDGAQIHVTNGKVVEKGTLLATEPTEQYRLVEVTEGKGPRRERLEYYSKKRRQWVQAGEHSTRRGALVEKAGREQITRELDAELAAAKKSPNAQDPNRLIRYVRVQHQNARGQGFDDVVVEFRGDPPKAKIRIVEIKDHPGRYLQLSEMSALRENLSPNMRRSRTAWRG